MTIKQVCHKQESFPNSTKKVKGVNKNMVDQDFDKFRNVQKKHRPTYLGVTNDEKKAAINDPEYNNQEDTDKSIGAIGRES